MDAGAPPTAVDLLGAIDAMGADLANAPTRFVVTEYTTPFPDRAAEASYVEPALSAFALTRIFEVRSAPPRLRLDVEYIAANPNINFVVGIRQTLCWTGSEYRAIYRAPSGGTTFVIATKPEAVFSQPAALFTWLGKSFWESPDVTDIPAALEEPGAVLTGPVQRDDDHWLWSFAAGRDGVTIGTLIYDIVLGRTDGGAWRVEEFDQYGFLDDRAEALRRGADIRREEALPICRLTMEEPWDPADPRRSLRATAEIRRRAPDGYVGVLLLQRLAPEPSEHYASEMFAPAMPDDASIIDERYGFARSAGTARVNYDGRLLTLLPERADGKSFTGDVGDDLERWCDRSEWGFVVVPSTGRFIKASEELTDEERAELDRGPASESTPTVTIGEQGMAVRNPVHLDDGVERVRQEFLLQNGGSAPRRVVDTQMSCRCTGVEVDRTPIAPGATARVVMTTELGAVGPYRYTATLTCDDGTTTVLTVAGRAERSNELRTILSTPFTDPRDRVRVRLMSISTGAELARAPLHWTLPDGVHVEDGAWFLVEKAIEPRLRPERCVRTAWLDFNAYTGPYPVTIEIESENGAKSAFTILGPDPLAPKISVRR